MDLGQISNFRHGLQGKLQRMGSCNQTFNFKCSANPNKDVLFLHQVPNFLPSHYPTNMHKSKVKYIRIFDLGLAPIIHCYNLLFQDLKNMKINYPKLLHANLEQIPMMEIQVRAISLAKP